MADSSQTCADFEWLGLDLAGIGALWGWLEADLYRAMFHYDGIGFDFSYVRNQSCGWLINPSIRHRSQSL